MTAIGICAAIALALLFWQGGIDHDDINYV